MVTILVKHPKCAPILQEIRGAADLPLICADTEVPLSSISFTEGGTFLLFSESVETVAMRPVNLEYPQGNVHGTAIVVRFDARGKLESLTPQDADDATAMLQELAV